MLLLCIRRCRDCCISEHAEIWISFFVWLVLHKRHWTSDQHAKKGFNIHPNILCAIRLTRPSITSWRVVSWSSMCGSMSCKRFNLQQHTPASAHGVFWSWWRRWSAGYRRRRGVSSLVSPLRGVCGSTGVTACSTVPPQCSGS